MRRRNFIKGAFGLVAVAAMNIQMLRAEKFPVQQSPEPEPAKAKPMDKDSFTQLIKQFDKFILDNYYRRDSSLFREQNHNWRTRAEP